MHIVRRYKALLIILGVYVIGSIILLKLFRHQINPDGISYMSIAKQYADGHFGEAINGYWGPMLSWLLVPFAKLGIDLQLAAKLINAVAGAAILLLAWVLAKQLRMHAKVTILVVSLLVPLVWYWVFPSPITPDVLAIVMVLGYMVILTNKQLDVWRRAAFLGVLGAVSYTTKSFLLAFFVAHLALWITYEVWRHRYTWQRGLQLFGISMAVLVVLAAPWVAAISMKYGQLTLSTSGSYNFNLIGPEMSGHPMKWEGLLAPPNEQAISVWEDPATMPMKTWNPLESRANAAFFVNMVLENIRVIGNSRSWYV